MVHDSFRILIKVIISLSVLDVCKSDELPPRPIIGRQADCKFDSSLYTEYLKSVINTTSGLVVKNTHTNDTEVPNQYYSQFPWTVAIFGPEIDKDGKIGNKERFYCSGVLIAEDVVLTAAQCLVKDIKKSKADLPKEFKWFKQGEIQQQFKVLVGYKFFDESKPDYKVQDGDETSEQIKAHEIMDVSSAWPHPSFMEQQTAPVVYDIGILTLKKKITVSTWVKPVCLEQSLGHRIPKNDHGACQGFVCSGYGPPTQFLTGKDENLRGKLVQYQPKYDWVATRLMTRMVYQQPTAFSFNKSVVMLDSFTSVGQEDWAIEMLNKMVEMGRVSEDQLEKYQEFYYGRTAADKPEDESVSYRMGWSGAPLLYVIDDHWYLYGIVSGPTLHDHLASFPMPITVTSVAVPSSQKWITGAIVHCKRTAQAQACTLPPVKQT